MTQNQSWQLFKRDASEQVVGWYGGHPRGIRAQDWPRCRVCGAPMCHMAQIDAGPWLDLGGYQRMSIFICHATGGHCEDWDPFKGSNVVMLHTEKNNTLYDGPPTVRVYRRVTLTTRAAADEPTFGTVTESEDTRMSSYRYDKLGGQPVWITHSLGPVDRQGEPLPLLMQMTTDLVKFDITSQGMAYVFLDARSGRDARAYLLWQGT